MAGRILPIALAAIAGISIGVATFDGEFKEQRRKRLEEDYKKEVQVKSSTNPSPVSPLNSAGRSPIASITMQALTPEQRVANKADIKIPEDSSWSGILGLWAWSKTKDKPSQDSLQNSNQEVK